MKQFAEYATKLQQVALEVLRSGLSDSIKSQLNDILDSQPNSALRQQVPLDLRRKSGAFFTGKVLADRLLRLVPAPSHRTIYCDPACGAGDLLLAACRTLPLKESFSDTLKLWGERIIGFDIYQEFIVVAKARLILLAAERCSSHQGNIRMRWRDVFPQIKRADGLEAINGLSPLENLVILLNPPYFRTTAPEDCEWAGGSINFGALFVLDCVRRSLPGTRIAAILPEVLRSGSRYKKWREVVDEYSTDLKAQIEDQFDEWTDINVYLTSLSATTADKKNSPADLRSSKSNSHTRLRVGDLFEVSVGPVVPHRHKRRGKSYRFIHARILKPWQVMKSTSESRRFKGTVRKPPFVAVRRTSRPGDKHRAIGTIITGTATVAVENHLLVISPRDGTLSSCKLLLKSLRTKETSEWLDRRIRCRHLTVESIKELPLFPKKSRNH